jgi:hypothetical protein
LTGGHIKCCAANFVVQTKSQDTVNISIHFFVTLADSDSATQKEAIADFLMILGAYLGSI